MARTRLLVFLALLALIGTTASPALAVNNSDSSSGTGAADGYAMVILADPPVAAWPGAKRANNGKIEFNNGDTGRYRASLAQARKAFADWLKRTGSPAKVLREYDTVLNGLGLELNGASLDSLRAGPGVTTVEPSATYRLAMNRSLGLINAATLWTALGGVANAGNGMKVGVIDSGIDNTHPFLTQALPPAAGFPKFHPGNAGFTSSKVIVAKVYFTGKPGTFTAQDFNGHGTHVSGTVAGVHGTSAPLIGAETVSGVAPKAYLGNYNVFPGTIDSAFSHDIAMAIEDAVKDGMDVINMSLGGGINGLHDQLTIATNRAVDAGVVVAVAAGNEGPGRNTVGSPAQAEKAITAAASTNNRFFGISVVVAATATTTAATFGAAVGQFNPYVPAVTAPLANWNNQAAGAGVGTATRACTGIASGTHTGQIVVIDRGVCTFSTKIRHAQNAGAAGVLVVNNVAGDPFAMAQDGTPNQPTIPAAMVAQADRSALRTRAAAAATASADGTVIVQVPAAANVLASFSSRGPSNLLDLKPDVTAPGVNVYSSVPGGAFEAFQGTSMSTPHVAGSAALLRQLHPSWTPAMVKSALVDSASRPAALGTANPTNRGGGIIDLAAAGVVKAVLDPASLSFRKIEPESGRSKSVEVKITNVTGAAQTYTLSPAITFSAGFPLAPTGATISASPSSVTLGAGQSATVTVTFDTTHDTPSGQYWGDLNVTATSGGPGSFIRAPFWLIVRTWVDAGPLI